LTIKAQQIDPRDTRWEIDSPGYRVYFWHSQSPGKDSMRTSDEWQLTDVDDVIGVMRWAESNSNGRQFVIYATALTEEGLGLIRLFGLDPAANQPTNLSNPRASQPELAHIM
jgi:hypothetical protein